MIALSLSQIAAVVGGRVDGPDEAVTVTGPAFLDSRTPEPGGLFVAIAGERVDGHDYAGSAVTGGAAAVLGTRSTGVPAVLVSDPVEAIGRLARHVLDTLRAAGRLRVLAMTGSQGKTGTKDYLAAILAGVGNTIAPHGNANNELGVPMTVLRATPDTEFLILEMGARGVGHIEYLCQIAPPDVAAVLNVGTAHVGEFGSVERIAQAKGEIVEALGADGVAVLAADDPAVAAMARRTVAGVCFFGTLDSPDPDRPDPKRPKLGWSDVRLDDLDRPTFTLRHGQVATTVSLRASGRHQVANATAAAAMAQMAGVAGLDRIGTALAAARPASRYRMELTERADGTVVINDSYNANPASMRAALDTLTDIGGRRGARTVACLGAMAELGQASDADHQALGEYVAAAGVDLLLTVGDPARPIHDAAVTAGPAADWQGEARHVATNAQALADLRHNVRAGDIVLVKASRAAGLETLGEALAAPGPAAAGRRQGQEGAATP